VGAMVGGAVGVGGLAWYHRVMRQADGGELFPLVLDSGLFIVTLLLAPLTGLLAATAPALRAARMDPVEAIRG